MATTTVIVLLTLIYYLQCASSNVVASNSSVTDDLCDPVGLARCDQNKLACGALIDNSEQKTSSGELAACPCIISWFSCARNSGCFYDSAWKTMKESCEANLCHDCDKASEVNSALKLSGFPLVILVSILVLISTVC